jgi:polysaccharide deacetylase 2 family uncharacterized protein YibQ
MLLLGVAALLVGGVWLAARWRAGRPPLPWSSVREAPAAPSGSADAPRRSGATGRPPQPLASGSEPAVAAPTPPAGHLALVIDDLGRSVEELAALEALAVPLSYSVLPFEERTAEVVALLRRRDAEILCHLPMEPGDGYDPGPGALVAAMGGEGLAGATRVALARVPGAVGANNHMGSILTADQAAMGPILHVLQQEGLFFLDSRTSPGSVGYSLARSLGLPAAQRDVFLDDDPQPAAVREQFRRLLDRSRQQGAAIAIAHPHPSTLAVLREEVPRAQAEGFTFVPVSFLLDRTGDPL